MFEHAYAAVPACSPSRTAMLLGMDPMRTGTFVNLQSWLFAKVPAGATSLFGHFRSHGWYLGGTGKLFHRSIADLRTSDWDDYWQPGNYGAWNSDTATDIAASADGSFDFGPSEIAGRSDLACTGWIVERLRAGAFDAGSSFLALGLNRPHLPHSVPQEWFEPYPERVTLPLGYWPGATDLDGNLPDQEDLGPMARRRIEPGIGDRLTNNDELNAYLRAYYASTTFADGQLGRVLDALDTRGLRETTYIVVTSDNGFMLGEKRDFTKFELREIALRVPLFISGPGIAPQVVKTPMSSRRPLSDSLRPRGARGSSPMRRPEPCAGAPLRPAPRARAGDLILRAAQPQVRPVAAAFEHPNAAMAADQLRLAAWAPTDAGRAWRGGRTLRPRSRELGLRPARMVQRGLETSRRRQNVARAPPRDDPCRPLLPGGHDKDVWAALSAATMASPIPGQGTCGVAQQVRGERLAGTWLTALWTEPKALQRPLPDGALRIVAQGEKEDIV